MQQITIIGMGLIGGSLGLALKGAYPNGPEIVGFDVDGKAASRALKLNAIDRREKALRRSVKGSQLVILATPVLAMREVMEKIASGLEAGCVVTDTGSTKAQVMSWAQEYLPSSVDFVGGHPMAGKEVPGIGHSDPALFEGATYCIIPSPGASHRAVEMVRGLADKIGAVPFFPDAAEHDGLVAAVSHLPMILSSALISVTTASKSWREMSKLASTGFKSSTRLASTDPDMSIGICLTNKDALEHWIDRFILELEGYKDLIRGDEEKLRDNLARVREARERWVSGQEVWHDGPIPEIPGVAQHLTGLFVGERLARRTSEMINLGKTRLAENLAKEDESKRK